MKTKAGLTKGNKGEREVDLDHHDDQPLAQPWAIRSTTAGHQYSRSFGYDIMWMGWTDVSEHIMSEAAHYETF